MDRQDDERRSSHRSRRPASRGHSCPLPQIDIDVGIILEIIPRAFRKLLIELDSSDVAVRADDQMRSGQYSSRCRHRCGTLVSPCRSVSLCRPRACRLGLPLFTMSFVLESKQRILVNGRGIARGNVHVAAPMRHFPGRGSEKALPWDRGKCMQQSVVRNALFREHMQRQMHCGTSRVLLCPSVSPCCD